MKTRYLLHTLLLIIVGSAQMLLAQNPNCTIIIPASPLSAKGLATPYQLTATNPANGPCDEANSNSSAFVQAAILDPASGQISIYNPLVIDAGSTPAVAPIVPVLATNAVVALWFGFNGDDLTLQGATSRALRAGACVNGLPNNVFGQFAYCNAVTFFHAARYAIRAGQLQVPALGTAADNLPCPSVRDFFVVDQDQSDNLPVSYLISTTGSLAQNTTANQQALPGATTLGNPSDNGLLDKFLDPALSCNPWKVPDLTDPGQVAAGLPLNEIQAEQYQARPVARIPIGDPMALNADGTTNLAKVNAYRRGVDQRQAQYAGQADTARYCRNLLRTAPRRMLTNEGALLASPTPVPGAADSLYTFMAQRFAGTYELLHCSSLTEIPDPVSVTLDSNGVATSATITWPLQWKYQQTLNRTQSQDAAVDPTGPVD
jgi:hypothetical protein